MVGPISLCPLRSGQPCSAGSGAARGFRQRFASMDLRDGCAGIFGVLPSEHSAVQVLFVGDVFFCADLHTLPSLPEYWSADLFYSFVRFSDFAVLFQLPAVCGVSDGVGLGMQYFPQ